MNKQEIDKAVRHIAAITRGIGRDQWELATALAAFSPLEYEQVLPRLVSETGWSRQRLTAARMTGKQWKPEERLETVPYALHERFRYKPEELRRQDRAGTLGQVTPAKRRQQWTLTQMQAAITSILDIIDDPNVADDEFRIKVDGILLIWRGAKAAA